MWSRVAFFGGIFSCSALIAQTNPEQCFNIESDLGRLECYDSYYGEVSSPTMSTGELFEEFRVFVTLPDNPMVSFSIEQLFENPCHIRSRYVVLHVGSYGGERRTDIHVGFTEVNLLNVERIGSEDSDGLSRYQQAPRGVQMVHERDYVGYVTEYYNQVIEELFQISGIDLSALRVTRQRTDRTITFRYLPAEYREDRQRALEALSQLWAACRGS